MAKTCARLLSAAWLALMTIDSRPILIAGPTASGKSALALQLARERNGVVINADSMQVYRELRIITARPSAEEEAQAPHRLYGHVPAVEPYSVARWLADARDVLDDVRAQRRTPIIVGGTGLYFKALLEGLSPIPEIPQAVRDHWRAEAKARGAAGLHDELQARDPAMAARLSRNDTQRITRALEVLDATGRSLAAWQKVPGNPVLRLDGTERHLVDLPRAVLHERCDRRFDQMMAMGALDEVRVLAALGLDPGLPAMNALGVRPLLRHLCGEIDLATAVAAGKLETRQYVKRQATWSRQFFMSWSAT